MIGTNQKTCSVAARENVGKRALWLAVVELASSRLIGLARLTGRRPIRTRVAARFFVLGHNFCCCSVVCCNGTAKQKTLIKHRKRKNSPHFLDYNSYYYYYDAADDDYYYYYYWKISTRSLSTWGWKKKLAPF